MKKETVAITLRLDKDLVERLDKIAKEELRSRTSQLTLFVIEAMKQHSRYQKVSDLKVEMEQRANPPTEDLQEG